MSEADGTDGDRSQEPPTILLTGFPGFLGSALIERLLDRGDGPIACLIQPKYRALAERRAASLAGSGSDRIQLFEGDITRPGLGLDDGLSALESVTELYHLAAIYDLAVDLEPAEAVNVRGTEHVLDAADDLDIDRFQYVSTCYVSGRYDGVFTEDHLREGQTFNNHYEETKYRAEVAVQERMADGLPATIYRPAIVVGDSETGETGKYDGPYYLIRNILSQSSACSITTGLPGGADSELNVVPRDFVVDAIAHLSAREDAVGEVYQLCDPAPLSIPDFVDAIGEATGHRVVSLPSTKPIAKRLMGALAARGDPAEPATLDYLDHPTRYACPNARRALAGTGIECPPFESYVDELVAFVREHPDIGDEAMT
ncbi:NAD-dependent epimerase/dehydratase family protein [Natronorubrum sp. JWXQ-INN-674]|uniref:NAD-dependent epimerase/dehydratase family protein n=1 Tax=Natronorubrum halalkaliphilum TaxID=2691917 RepID=A0A6B0VPK5_9EURY|nr:SDR family oxidoreductase [Natronorubrum halalkaliphilum]MXV62916.1 NAD-dependent epimerase/dehydratase family protein [Natronorubrum halalkaliphilum]